MALTDKLKAIADAIRTMTGKTDPLTLTDMPLEILGIVGTGGASDPILPSGYTRVNYIRFTGDQMVDTGIICNLETKIRVLFTREVSAAMYLYGVASSGNTASVTAYLSSSGAWRFGNKSASYTVTVNPDLVQTAIVSKTGIVRANATSSFSGTASFTTVGTLLIGGGRNADGTLGVSSYIGNIFIFEIWDGSTQVLKLVPCKNPDGVYGFWDTINNQFHESITSTPLEGGYL